MNNYTKKNKTKIKEILESDDKLVPDLENLLSASTERAVLSIALNSPEDFALLKSSVDEKDFGHQTNRHLWEIIQTVSDSKNNGNYVTKEQLLYEESFFESFKKLGVNDLIEALSVLPYNKLSLPHLMKILKTKRAQRQKWHDECETMEELLSFQGESVEEILAIGQDRHFNSIIENKDSIKSIYKMGSELEERLKDREENPEQYESFNFSWFPEISKILDPSVHELIIGAARPKTGKSILLNQMFANLSVWGKGNGAGIIPCGYVDTEMEDYQQENRQAACIASVDELKIRKGLFVSNSEDRHKVYQAAKIMNSGQAYWTRVPIFNTKNIINSFKTLIALYGIKVGFFDQVKDTVDPTNPSSEKEHQRIGWLCLALKHLAEQEKMLIMAMMQLNRYGTDEALRTDHTDPSTVLADSDRALRFASKCFYLAKMPPKEIEKYGGVLKCGNTVFNLFASRSGECHSTEGGIGMLFRKRMTRFEEMGNLST